MGGMDWIELAQDIDRWWALEVDHVLPEDGQFGRNVS